MKRCVSLLVLALGILSVSSLAMAAAGNQKSVYRAACKAELINWITTFSGNLPSEMMESCNTFENEANLRCLQSFTRPFQQGLDDKFPTIPLFCMEQCKSINNLYAAEAVRMINRRYNDISCEIYTTLAKIENASQLDCINMVTAKIRGLVTDSFLYETCIR